MYISRMSLNVARADTLTFVSSPYKVHAAVEHAFAPQSMRRTDEGRILWRLDSTVHDRDALWLYVVSPEQPDFSHIVERVGWPTTSSWESKNYSPVIMNVSEGQVWQFRLKANPARTVKKDHGRRSNADVVGTVQGHITVAQQIEWLVNRSEAHGFTVVTGEDGIPAVTVSQRHKERFAHHGETVTISTARFDGILRVTDAEAFRKTLGFGIGRSKGFGCGLLTIAPVKQS